MFDEIKEKYPKVWNEFVLRIINSDTHLFEYDIHEPDKWKEIHNIPLESLVGWLFKFFDEQGIMINIAVYPTGDGEGYGFDADEMFCGAEIGCVGVDGVFKTRQEAWQAAFTKAFEILEEK